MVRFQKEKQMSSFYQQTAVFRFLKVAEMWGQETKTDMWTIARIMAIGTQPPQNENPLIIHHVSMLDAAGNHDPKGGFRNPELGNALNTLINDAPDQPTPKIISGVHDICVSKDNFRLWGVEKYPLPHFWFTNKERSTFSDAEMAQIGRVGKISLQEIKKQKSDSGIFELKPSFHGFSVDLKKLFKSNKNKKGI